MKRKSQPRAQAPDDRIAELIRTLREAEQELQELTGGQVDAVTGAGGGPLLLREAQEKLRQSETTQRALADMQVGILNALPAHIALLDRDGVIIAVNEAWRRFASANILQSADFYVGHNYIGVCEGAHGECSEESLTVAAGIRRVLRGEAKFFSLEYPCHSPDEKRWFRLMVTPLNDSPDAGAVVMHINVTERRLAEEALKERERQQRQLAERLTDETRRLHDSQRVANVGSWETDLATLEVSWTAETYRIFETSPETFRPSHQGFLAWVHPDDREAVNQAFIESATQPGSFSIEHRICLPDGRIKHVEERWQVFSGSDSQPARAVGTCQDITARKLAEELILTRARQQETIARIGFAATQANTLEEIFDLTTRSVAEALGVEYCKVLQLAPDGSHLRLVSGVGWKPGLIGVGSVKVDTGSQAGFTLKEGKAIYVNDLRTERRFVAPPLLVEHGVVSGLSVPINLRDKPWGVLGAHCRSVRRFNEEDCHFMESVAALLSVVIERLAIQRNLSESDRKMREAQRIAHLGNWELDLRKNELSWSDEVYRIFGQEPAGFGATFESFFEMVHPEDRERLLAAQERALRGEDILLVDHRIIRPDGEVRHVRERGELIRDEAGRAVALTGTVLDITEQARSEAALAESERRYRDLVENSHDLIYTVSPEGQLLFINEASRSVLGYAPEEMIGRHWVDFIPADRREQDLAVFAKIVASGESHTNYVAHALHKDGSTVVVRADSRALFDEDGKLIARVGTARDVTESIRAEEALRASESRLRAIVDNEPECVKIVSVDGTLLDMNPAGLRMIEASDGEKVIGKPVLGLIRAEDRNTFMDLHTRVTRGETGQAQFRITGLKGTELWMESHSVPLRSADGTITSVLSVTRDITQSKKAAEALRESEERFRLMIEGSEQVLFYTHDREHRFTYLSPSTKAVLGYAPEELVGQLYEVIVIAEDPFNASVNELTDKALADGKPVDPYLVAVRHKDGRRIVLEIIESPLLRDGNITGIQGFAKDITERKQAEAALRESEAHLQFTLESSQLGDWELDLATGTTRRSLRHDRCFGYTEPVVEWSFEKFIAHVHPDDRDRVERNFRACVEAHTPWDFECRVIWPDGATHWIGARGNVFLIDGQARRMHGIVRDITERKNAEEKLRQNQTMLRIAGSAAKLGGWSLDLPDYKLTWSDETAVIHDLAPGFTPSLEEAIAYYPPETRDEISERVRLLATDGIPFDFEHELITARQRRIWVRAIGEALRDDAGKIVRLYGAFQDITERKRAELEITRTNRALKMLSTCNEALVRAENEAALLAAFCENSCAIGGYRLTWVGYAREDAARTISIGARFGDESRYLDTIQLSWDETSKTGQGPAGRVICSGQPVICADFETDDQFTPWRETARQHGLRSVVCLPLRKGDHTFGLLGLYSSEVNHPGADELKLLQELANDLSFGIHNLRSQQQHRRMEAAVVKMATSVSASVSEGFFIDLAKSLAEALDAQGAFVARLLPGEPIIARTEVAVVDGKVVDNFEYPLRGTPCENLTSNPECVVPANVAAQFPESPSLQSFGAQAYVGRRLVNTAGQSVGLIFVLYREPLKEPGFALSTLQIFATRAAGEFERLEADTRIREQAALLDHAHEAILVQNLAGQIIYWNKGAERIYGWTAEEALLRKWDDLLDGDRAKSSDTTALLLEKG